MLGLGDKQAAEFQTPSGYLHTRELRIVRDQRSNLLYLWLMITETVLTNALFTKCSSIIKNYLTRNGKEKGFTNFSGGNQSNRLLNSER